MAALTFETREALLTLEQSGNDDAAPVISLKLGLSSTPTVYIANGQLLQAARWTMHIGEAEPGGKARDAGSLTYTNNDGKGECLILVKQSRARFLDVLDMFKGGHASEITIVVDGMQQRDDYSSLWNTETTPRLDVLRVSFEFPLPQSEA
jgi:hypothetical protein